MLGALTLFNSITRDMSKSLANVASEPTVQRATQNFQQNIGSIQSASQLVKNSNLYNYVMTAFGLSDMTNAKGLITKVLEGGTGNGSFAASLNDPRYTALASAFDFKTNGAATTSNATTIATTISNFNEQTLESNTAQENPGAQMALYFQRMAPNITSPFDILGDKTLLQVFETAFDLPTTMSLEPIDTQAKQVSQRLDISQLQNPKFLQNFLTRFTASFDAQNSGATSGPPANALLATSPGISSDLLLSLANLKLGGS
jgi:Protein of unknown function (DUF1217)